MIVDRITMVVTDREAVAKCWQDILQAEVVGQRYSALMGGQASMLAFGSSLVELVEPDETGVAADSLSRAGGRSHLFAAGIAVSDLMSLRANLLAHEISYEVDDGQLLLFPDAIGVDGLHLTINGIQARAKVGLADYLYEATLLTDQVDQVCDRIKTVLNNNGEAFVPIQSQKFGYSGQLTLFRSGHLHRIEVIHPNKPGTTMQRFHQKFGQSLYMAFCESEDILEIERRALDNGAGVTVDRPADRADDQMPDQLWLHPSALGGMMLGVSRPTRAWNWSGAPERVQPV